MTPTPRSRSLDAGELDALRAAVRAAPASWRESATYLRRLDGGTLDEHERAAITNAVAKVLAFVGELEALGFALELAVGVTLELEPDRPLTADELGVMFGAIDEARDGGLR